MSVETMLVEVSVLEQRVRELTRAAADAASVAERACERLVAAQPVLDAADALVDEPNSVNRHLALHQAVEAWRRSRPS